MSQEVKHTPGEWQDLDRETYVAIFAHGYESPIARIESYFPGFGPGRPERNANARLIAAAPDLLVAVQRCLNFIESTEAELGEEFDCGNIARAAIAKAEGGAS